ncbi:hypothetical protein DPEC_G00315220 [Dallia pectoralis]|uniref:Uncharacterized protein n=1 Tax=Dallia pectoralis TaxID=75939 RepID=A0ACC2FCF0_DALPE|nr:hypothetical protein DPEC_G00315220 [Dallia pectoralis]
MCYYRGDGSHPPGDILFPSCIAEECYMVSQAARSRQGTLSAVNHSGNRGATRGNMSCPNASDEDGRAALPRRKTQTPLKRDREHFCPYSNRRWEPHSAGRHIVRCSEVPSGIRNGISKGAFRAVSLIRPISPRSPATPPILVCFLIRSSWISQTDRKAFS